MEKGSKAVELPSLGSVSERMRWIPEVKKVRRKSNRAVPPPSPMAAIILN